MTVVVTGASGFVGRALMAHLSGQARSLSLRTDPTGWDAVLAGASCVVHLAARVHVMHDRVADPLPLYRAVNTVATLDLARRAVRAGARRFVFMSSVKVCGERTLEGQPFRESQAPAPEDPYGISKWEAEQQLLALGRETGLEVVIIRPPLVYGLGVVANFARLLQTVERGVPLPLAGVNNQRSLIALPNLVDFIVLCTRHPAAAQQTFLVSDGDDVSTPELIRRIAQAQGRRARLFYVPPAVLIGAARLFRRAPAVERLCGNLQVDSSHARTLLGWTPPLSMRDGLAQTVQILSK